jgi:hypothetical protein
VASLGNTGAAVNPGTAGECSGGPNDEPRLGIVEDGLLIESLRVPELKVEVEDTVDGAGVTTTRGGTLSDMGKPRSLRTFKAT